MYAAGGVKGIKRGGDAAALPRQQIIGAGGGAAVHHLQRHSLGGQCIVQRPRRAAERSTASKQHQVQRRFHPTQGSEIGGGERIQRRWVPIGRPFGPDQGSARPPIGRAACRERVGQSV